MKFSKSAIVALGTSLLVSPFVHAQTTPSANNDRPFKQFSVVIDAGHGGQDSGDAQGKVAEKDVTLALALKLRAELEQQGIQVVLTRSRNDFLPLQERVDIVNKIHPDCTISLHGATQQSALPYIISYYTSASSQLAQTLNQDISKSLKKQGRVDVQRYFIVRKPTVPSVMVTGNLTTLSAPAEQQKLVTAIAGGIEDYAQTLMAANKAALDRAKAENARKLEAQHAANKLSAERFRAQQKQMAKIKELLEAQRQVAQAEEQLAKAKKDNAKLKTDLAEAQAQAQKARTDALTIQLGVLHTQRQLAASQSSVLLRRSQPNGSSPMLLKPDDSHTYSIPNAIESLPAQPAPTTMSRKPEGPTIF